MPLESFMVKAKLSSSIPRNFLSAKLHIFREFQHACVCVHASDAEKEKNDSFSFHDNMKESVATFMTWGRGD